MADRDDRANYIAAAMAVAALVGGVSPLVGAGFMSWLRTEVSVEVAYKTIFGTTSLLRLVALERRPIPESDRPAISPGASDSC